MKIVVDQDGFCVNNGPDAETFAWTQVRKIVTFKRDQFTVDQICLGLFVGDSEASWIEINEDDEGFKSFMRAMQKQFPTIPENWYLEVMAPAFETNMRALWPDAEDPPAQPPTNPKIKMREDRLLRREPYLRRYRWIGLGLGILVIVVPMIFLNFSDRVRSDDPWEFFVSLIFFVWAYEAHTKICHVETIKFYRELEDLPLQ